MCLTIYVNQFGRFTERGGGGGNFLNLLQKEGGTQKGGFPQKRGGGSNPGGNYGNIFQNVIVWA